MITYFNHFFKRPMVFWSAVLVIAGLTFATSAIYPAYIFNKFSNYAVHILLLEFATVFFFLFISRYRLMWFTLVCTGLLSMHLKNASNRHLILPSRNTEAEIKIGLFHVNAMTDLLQDIAAVKKDDADIIIFNEISPEWSVFLGSELDSLYAFKIDLPRIDPYGTLIMTKIPPIKVDTLIFYDAEKQIPSINLLFTLKDGQTIGLTSLYNLPPISQNDYGLLNRRLENIIVHLQRFEQVPWIVVADLNMASWVNEISAFTAQLELQNSRRNNKLRKLSLDHIFYNNFFECYSFEEVEINGRYIGIAGSFQVLRELKPR